ncbi:MAG: alpha/beta hydrolase family protein [Parabacteroides merdae]
MWFANWDMGGAYWEKQNATAQRTFANSPHLFVDKWDTPILCIHGEKDYRILANQGMAAFNAAVLRGVPAELLILSRRKPLGAETSEWRALAAYILRMAGYVVEEIRGFIHKRENAAE